MVSGKTISASDNVEVGGPKANLLTLARENGLAMLRENKRVLERWNAADQAEFERWFGTSDEAYKDEVLAAIELEITALEAATNENFRLPKVGKDSDTLNAHVSPSDTDKKIHLGNNWFNYPETSDGGVDSQAATLIHEFSHFNDLGDTNDHQYGDKNTLQLAIDDPALAQENADTFENWSETIWGYSNP